MNKNIILIFCVLILNGCSIYYQVPVGEQVAQLKIPAPGFFFRGIVVDSMNVSVGELDEDGCITLSKRVTEEHLSKDGFLTVYAERDLMLNVASSIGLKSTNSGPVSVMCHVSGIVNLSRNKQYQLFYELDDAQCGLLVAEITQSGDLVPVRMYGYENSGMGVCKSKTDPD